MLTYSDISSIPGTIASLRATFESGVTRPLSWRRAQLRGLLSLVRENEDAIVAALAADLRRPAFDAIAMEVLVIQAEVHEALANLGAWAADEAVDTPLMLAPATSHIRKEPLGVALVIAPWNFPVMLSLTPLVSALAAGNACALKPSEVAPASAALLGALLPRYVDARACAVLQGGVDETTALLRERFDVILYTGNGAVGRVVATAAARHLTPVILELGGKNPAFVDASADLRAAARALVHGRCANAGQICLAPEVVLVEERVEAALTRELLRAVADFYGPDPRASADLARIINARHFARVAGLLAELPAGCVVCGGESDAAERYIAPTVLRDPPPGARIWAEEVFAPLLTVKPVRDLAAAGAWARARDKPLALYVFSTRAGVAEAAMELIPSGGVTLNGTLLHIGVPGLPFGGVGASGSGAYHGRRGFDAFSHARAVFTASRLVPVGDLVLFPPFTKTRLALLRALYAFVPARLLPAGGAGWLVGALGAAVAALVAAGATAAPEAASAWWRAAVAALQQPRQK
jgi:aldehyde dehydrogenase (NAD+)